MAHFAQLNQSNIVIQVIVVNNNELIDETGQENELRGVTFCQSLFGANTVWKQTSYNGNFRKNYAGIGYTYNEQLDGFIPPKEFNSWLLNEETCLWYAPIPMPTDGKIYQWDEVETTWKEIT